MRRAAAYRCPDCPAAGAPAAAAASGAGVPGWPAADGAPPAAAACAARAAGRRRRCAGRRSGAACEGRRAASPVAGPCPSGRTGCGSGTCPRVPCGRWGTRPAASKAPTSCCPRAAPSALHSCWEDPPEPERAARTRSRRPAGCAAREEVRPALPRCNAGRWSVRIAPRGRNWHIPARDSGWLAGTAAAGAAGLMAGPSAVASSQ